MNKIGVALLAGISAIFVAGAAQAEPQKFRISLETPPTHHRNIALKQFVKQLSQDAAGTLDVKLFESGQLFGGRDVPKALAQGTLEMGAPGMWQLGRFVKDAGVMQLPMFYGATRDQIHKVMDGELGQDLIDRIEKKLQVKVIGPQMDHGYANIYTVKQPINAHSDLKGLKLRVVGGTANKVRYQVFGAAPVSVAWGDTPLALTQGTIEGLFTTHVTVASAKLWDSGVRYSYEDQQWFAQYVPMVSRKIWDGLSADVQKSITGAWAASISGMRTFTKDNQARARAELEKNGITVVQGSAKDLSAMRTKLLAKQDEIVEASGMTPAYVARVKAAMDKVLTN